MLGADLITGQNRIAFADSGTVSFLDFTKTLFSETNHTVLSSVKSIDFFLDANGGDSGQAFRIFNNTNPDGSVTESNYIFKVSENGNVDITGNLTISDAYTLPTSDGSVNQVLATDGPGNKSRRNCNWWYNYRSYCWRRSYRRWCCRNRP